MRALAILIIGWTCLAVRAAEPVSLTAVFRGSSPRQPFEARLRAHRVGDSGPPVEQMLSIPGTADIALPEGNWELSVHSPLFWSAPAVVSSGHAATVELWPAGTLTGTVKTELKGGDVRELRVSFAPSPEVPAGQSPAGDSSCSLDKDRWECLVPAGTHDLRLVARGFTAEFRWAQEVAAARKTDLGQLKLRRGAALTGFVTAARGLRPVMRDVVVTARPAPDSRRAYTATVNERGFFQIAGLPAGEYRVRAAAGRLRSDERPAGIIEDRNAELRSPLVLDVPRTLIVSVDSPATSANDPWQIRLFRYVRDANRLDDPVVGDVDGDGQWSTEVVPGEYRLHVDRADGSTWHSADVTVGDDDVRLKVSIPVRQVRGRVKLGARLLRGARLMFGGDYGGHRLDLTTDDDGEFSGVLPDQENGATKWTITIDAETPRVRRTAQYEPIEDDRGELRLDIDIPETMLMGKVVDEKSAPAPGAWITLWSSDGSVFDQVAADQDGRFELFGFDPGTYRIQADGFQRSSEVAEVHATESVAAPLELVLRSEAVVRGRVRARNAAGVESVLTAVPRNVPAKFVPTATTDSNGFFELRLPPGTRAFDLIVQAPGFPLSLGRVTIQDDKYLTLTLDQNSGTLTAELPAGRNATIRHDGAEVSLRFLATFAGGSVTEREGEGAVTIASIEAGDYMVCVDSSCEGGVLAPHGSLHLSLRSDQ